MNFNIVKYDDSKKYLEMIETPINIPGLDNHIKTCWQEYKNTLPIDQKNNEKMRRLQKRAEGFSKEKGFELDLKKDKSPDIYLHFPTGFIVKMNYFSFKIRFAIDDLTKKLLENRLNFNDLECREEVLKNEKLRYKLLDLLSFVKENANFEPNVFTTKVFHESDAFSELLVNFDPPTEALFDMVKDEYTIITTIFSHFEKQIAKNKEIEINYDYLVDKDHLNPLFRSNPLTNVCNKVDQAVNFLKIMEATGLIPKNQVSDKLITSLKEQIQKIKKKSSDLFKELKKTQNPHVFDRFLSHKFNCRAALLKLQDLNNEKYFCYNAHELSIVGEMKPLRSIQSGGVSLSWYAGFVKRHIELINDSTVKNELNAIKLLNLSENIECFHLLEVISFHENKLSKSLFGSLMDLKFRMEEFVKRNGNSMIEDKPVEDDSMDDSDYLDPYNYQDGFLRENPEYSELYGLCHFEYTVEELNKKFESYSVQIDKYCENNENNLSKEMKDLIASIKDDYLVYDYIKYAVILNILIRNNEKDPTLLILKGNYKELTSTLYDEMN